MSNLKRLHRTCKHHLFPIRMTFAGWAGSYRPVYRCPSCKRKKIYFRKCRFGRVVRVA